MLQLAYWILDDLFIKVQLSKISKTANNIPWIRIWYICNSIKNEYFKEYLIFSVKILRNGKPEKTKAGNREKNKIFLGKLIHILKDILCHTIF